MHIYINSPGGECFEANEIVNVIKKFPGKITGEGGALVASAATYIAINCTSFSMPANGLFMIHQVSGGACGLSLIHILLKSPSGAMQSIIGLLLSQPE